jgi:hypothetical protein
MILLEEYVTGLIDLMLQGPFHEGKVEIYAARYGSHTLFDFYHPHTSVPSQSRPRIQIDSFFPFNLAGPVTQRHQQ